MAQKTITDIKGVFANGVACGIKPGRKDLAFIWVPEAHACAGVFTRNKFIAPCLEYTKKCFQEGTLKAVIVNAGNANAATGIKGYQNAEKTAVLAASRLGLKPSEVAVCSTGIIGVQLPMDKIEAGIAALLEDPKQSFGSIAAEAIRTTDLTAKEVFLTSKIDGKEIAIAGIAKGSGMIAPNMATMLAYFTTNAKVNQKELTKFLQEAVDDTFNMTSVDTDTSTNDMVLLFSTAEHAIDFSRKENSSAFSALLKDACTVLAKMIAQDGEGAERLIEVTVKGAKNKQEARTIAKNIVNSPLVKTAIHGADPNWGRVLAAAGKAPECTVDQNQVDLYFSEESDSCQIISKGKILSFDRQALINTLKKDSVSVILNLNLGDGLATAWGCDLTKGYIDINTDYS